MDRRTITDVFLNPNPDEVDAVTRERQAGLDELEMHLSYDRLTTGENIEAVKARMKATAESYPEVVRAVLEFGDSAIFPEEVVASDVIEEGELL